MHLHKHTLVILAPGKSFLTDNDGTQALFDLF